MLYPLAKDTGIPKSKTIDKKVHQGDKTIKEMKKELGTTGFIFEPHLTYCLLKLQAL